MYDAQTLVNNLGYDPGEWIADWVSEAVERPTLALPLGIVGPTGTGKSNFAWGVLWLCASQGDCVVIPGDAACEFRHFLNYTKHNPIVSLRIIIPEDFEFDFFIGKSNDQTDFVTQMQKMGAEVIKYNIYSKGINDFIEPATILVVMDACFTLEAKSWFWQYSLKQIKYRKRYHYIHVTYCFPEASTYFPNTPFREQFKPVYLHSKDFVEYRKFFMRGIYIYHHASMLFYLIEKQFETIVKKGSSRETRTPLDNHYGRGKNIREYSIVYQGYEDIKLMLEGEFQEIKTLWKIIPDKEVNFNFKHWESQEEESMSEKDKLTMLLTYKKQIKKDNPDWTDDDIVTELFLMNPDASVQSIVSITGITERRANRLKGKALEELLDQESQIKKNTSSVA